MLEDTKALLGDCRAGIELAVSTMDNLLPRIQDQTLRRRLRDGIQAHTELEHQVDSLLHQVGGRQKHPSPMAKAMAHLKTSAKMAWGDDTTAASLVAEGCGMGIASLCRSRNRCADAGPEALSLSQSLLECEEKLSADMRPFL